MISSSFNQYIVYFYAPSHCWDGSIFYSSN
ncbi:hypothetical protein VPHF99_0304 [Vibrio phage F99]